MADMDFVEVNESDPAAEFLAREQETLAGLEDEFDSQLNIGVQKGGLVADYATDSLEDQEQVNGEHVNEHVNGTNGYNSSYDSAAASNENRVEPEKIRVWREEQAKMLENKDAEEETKRNELRESAKKELDEWYSRYAEQLEKSKSNNRNSEQEWIAERDADQPGQDWEKIAKLCDFNPKAARNTKDTSRMKSILLQLKQNPPVAANAATVS
ncbi:Clathrin light chain A [Halotydeus destructor]|nr:Clathrin light chain A [Halotydeus destructor]